MADCGNARARQTLLARGRVVRAQQHGAVARRRGSEATGVHGHAVWRHAVPTTVAGAGAASRTSSGAGRASVKSGRFSHLSAAPQPPSNHQPGASHSDDAGGTQPPDTAGVAGAPHSSCVCCSGASGFARGKHYQLRECVRGPAVRQVRALAPPLELPERRRHGSIPRELEPVSHPLH